MSTNELKNISPESAPWQDYRSSNTAMVVYYASDPVAELPIREVPEELGSDIPPEPNYETGTYGLYGCGKTRIRNAFFKEKIRYLLFATKYAGTKNDFKDKYFITGYFRITKTADVKKIHLRYGSDYSCIDEENCYALRSDEGRFVAIEDAYAINDEVQAGWNYKARLSKQTRIILDEQHTMQVVDFLKSKPDCTAQYCAETKRLQPRADLPDEIVLEDFTAPAASVSASE